MCPCAPHNQHKRPPEAQYCPEHRGLALFIGLRHAPRLYDEDAVGTERQTFCDACAFWNHLGLKIESNHPSHVHTQRMTLPSGVPLVDLDLPGT